MTAPGNARAFRAALFCLSASLLSLELALMRVFKIEGFGNFTSTAIALALLGFGASGTLAGLFARLRLRQGLRARRGVWIPMRRNVELAFAPAFFCLTLGLAFTLSEAVDFDPLRILWDESQLLRLSLRFSLYTLPFILGAAFVLTAFRTESTGKAYFFNLTGSAFGTCALLFSLYVLPPGKVFLVPLTFSFCALAFVFLSVRVGWRAAVGASLIAAAGMTLVVKTDVSILPYRARQLALNLPDARILSRRHTPFGTLEIIESEHLRYAPGLSLAYQGKLPGQLGLYLDGDRLGAIDLTGTGGAAQPDYLRRQIQFAPYALRTFAPRAHAPRVPSRTLVIGLGGGVGVERALAGNSRDITAVEQNPGLPSFLIDSLETHPGAPLRHIPFTVVKGSARRYLERTARKWDVIELSLPDSGTSSIGGIYSAFFDYSITEEAFDEYLRHLDDDGILSVTVTLENPPRTLPKLIATAKSALARREANIAPKPGSSLSAAPGRATRGSGPSDRIIALRSWSTGTVLIRNTPFQAGEVERIKAFCSRNSFDLVYYPGIREGETNLYNIQEVDLYFASARAILEEGTLFADSYVFDIRPPTDDRPYFFSFLRLKTVPFLFREMGKTWLPMVEGGVVVLFSTLAALSVLSSLLIGVPFLLLRRGMRGKGFQTFSYFSLIAAGYMFMEIMLMERLARVLAHPMLSNSAVLASLLVFSGIGSYYSDHWRLRGKAAVFIAVGFITVYGAWILMGSGVLYPFLSRVSLPLAALFAILILSPLALAMGIPFPAAIRLVRDKDMFTLPWAWSVNGYFSVIASVGAPLISVGAGLSALGALALLCYAASAFAFPE